MCFKEFLREQQFCVERNLVKLSCKNTIYNLGEAYVSDTSQFSPNNIWNYPIFLPVFLAQIVHNVPVIMQGKKF